MLDFLITSYSRASTGAMGNSRGICNPSSIFPVPPCVEFSGEGSIFMHEHVTPLTRTMLKDTRACCAVLRVRVQRARLDVGRKPHLPRFGVEQEWCRIASSAAAGEFSGNRRFLYHDRRSSKKAYGSRGDDNSAREDKSHTALTAVREADTGRHVHRCRKVDYLPKT